MDKNDIKNLVFTIAFLIAIILFLVTYVDVAYNGDYHCLLVQCRKIIN